MLLTLCFILSARGIVPVEALSIEGSQQVLPVPTNYFLLHEDDPEYWVDVSDRVIVGYRQGVDLSTKVPGLISKGASFIRTSRGALNFVVMRLPSADPITIKSYIHSVLEDPDVLYAEPDKLYHACRTTPNDTRFADQWSHQALNTEKAWDFGYGNTSVVIAIVDQGVQYDHPDLDGHFIGYIGYDQVDDDGDPYPEASYEDHGTHCAGVAAAEINNNEGIAGMSNSRLISERCLDQSGSGWMSDIADGITDAADNGADIISMSLGGGYSSTVDNACQYAWNQGCLLVAASGNDGASSVSYPAALNTVMAVGAIGPSDAYPTFSNRGPNLDVVAPGVSVLSTVYANSYDSTGWSGTSMACPHVAGLAGLLKAINPSLTNRDLWDIIDSTATDIWYPGRDDTTGYGKINPYWACRAADGVIFDPDTLPGPSDYYGPPFYYFQASYREEYEATLAVPETACVVQEIWIAFYNFSSSQTNKDVHYGIWDDNSGQPGGLRASWTVNIDLNASTGSWIGIDVSSSNITYATGERFWFGHWETDTLPPTSLIDTTHNSGVYWSTDGSSWSMGSYDYLQYVVVSKPGGVGYREVIGPDGRKANLSLMAPRPSVVRDAFEISFVIPYTQAGRLDIYDAAGRVVWTTGTKTMQGGIGSISVDASGLAPGHYFAVLSCQSGTATQRFTKVR